MSKATLKVAAVAIAAVLSGCDDNHNRTPEFPGPGGGDRERIGGFKTIDPNAAVTPIGDVNGDGAPDYAVGEGDAPNGGRVTIRSGLTSTVIRTIPSPAFNAAFGRSVAAAGDVNGDGQPDLLVGAPNEVGGGSAYVVSGKNGAVIRRLAVPATPGLQFGTSVLSTGDLNADNIPDQWVAQNGLSSAPGSVTLFSGSDGSELNAVLYSSTGGSPKGVGPTGLYDIGDQTGDGKSEFVIGFDGEATPIPDGVTLRPFRTHAGRSTSATPLGDINGDGATDYAIGYPHRNDKKGQVEVFSGSDGRRIRVIDGTRPGDQFGHSVASLSDRDDDGIQDVAIGARGYVRFLSGAGLTQLGDRKIDAADTDLARVISLGDLNQDGFNEYAIAVVGKVTIYSGRALALTADKFEISVSGNEFQTMSIDFGPEQAGRNYFVIGSVTGVAPGTPVGSGLRLPINLDAYTEHTVNLVPGQGLLQYVGTLSPNGTGTAFLAQGVQLPPGLVGYNLYHAVLVMNSLKLPTATSNPIAVTFVR